MRRTRHPSRSCTPLQRSRSVAQLLPAELWTLSWEFLSLTDCVAIAQSCKYFRQLALNCPSVWCQVDITISQHPTQLKPITNFGLVSRVLEWSRAAPLDVRLVITALGCYGTTELNPILQTLADLLAPHITRLRSLDVDVVDLEQFNTLTSYMAVTARATIDLPALRSLRLVTRLGYPVPTALQLPAFSLHKLERLETGPGVAAGPLLAATSSFERLVELSCEVTSSDDLTQVTEHLRGLARLSLFLAGSQLYLTPMPTAVQLRGAAARALTSVHITGLHDHHEGALLDLLRTLSTCAEIALEYSSSVEDVRGLGLFAQVTGPVLLECVSALGGVRLSVRAVSPSSSSSSARACTRSVAFPLMTGSRFASRIWQSVHSTQVVSLRVDNRLWRRLFTPASIPNHKFLPVTSCGHVCLPNLRTLDIDCATVGSFLLPGDVLSVLSEHPKLEAQRLEEVRLAVHAPTKTTQVVDGASIASLLDIQLGITGYARLEVLACSGFIVLGGTSKLLTLVDVVRDDA